MLTLADQLFMLTIRDDQGLDDVSLSKSILPGLAGAVLMELAFDGKIKLNQNHRIELVDFTLPGDRLLDQALSKIKKNNQPRKTGFWLKELQWKEKKIKSILVDHLVTEGIFKKEEDNAYWLIPSIPYPDIKANAKYVLKEHLRAIVLAGKDPDAHDLALLSLACANNQWKALITREERKIASQNIHQLLLSEAMKNPDLEVIEEIHSAVAAKK